MGVVDMNCEKELVQKILIREKQRLDNQSVFGGFDDFLKKWIENQSISLSTDWLQALENYPTMSEADKKQFLTSLESYLFTYHQTQISSPVQIDCSQSVRFLKGVGPVVEKQLNRLNIFTIEDLILYFPRIYRDRGNIVPISKIRENTLQTILGTVVHHLRVSTRHGKLLKIVVKDNTGTISLVCFNRDFLARIIPPGKKILITGFFNSNYGKKESSRFEYEILENDEVASYDRILPVYGLTEGFNQRKLQSLLTLALDSFLSGFPDILPLIIKKKYHLGTKSDSIRELHRPIHSSVLDLNSHRSQAHLTLIFEEFLLFALSLKMRRYQFQSLRVSPISASSPLVSALIQKLPFDLTEAQKKVFAQITNDLTSGFVMNRLVQGDVGSGKTLVAVLSALSVIGSGQQAALMAPTEILAEQHYRRWRVPLEEIGVHIGLITGGNNKKKKESIQSLSQGHIQLVVGTHALLEDYIQFNQLGLVIVDEQHRFGVMQRARLKEKASVPHLLVMTATPIPRTLALTLYGDLDISIIDQKPAGRKPVETVVFPMNEQFKAYHRVRHFLEKGQQAYVVCPAIDESEQELSSVYEIIELLRNKWFPEYSVELIHGKLPASEKDEIMSRFSCGEINLLVATSVIEVGIDVANANVMVIENAERFGLAQLHQLRGRIGRGDQEGLCILLYQGKSETIQKRMEIMIATNDGFRIAEEDLKLRGPGEFYGVRQSGIPEFRVGDPFQDWAILKDAHREAELILNDDPALQKGEYQKIRCEIERRFGRYYQLGFDLSV